MKNNGLKIVSLVLFLALSVYYLYPSLRDYQLNRQLTALSGEEYEAFQRDNFRAIESAREGALKLGLDLRGGMLVTLEVRVSDLLRNLAENTDGAFEAALASATEQIQEGGSNISFIDAFVGALGEQDPNFRLSRYFRDQDQEITRRSENDEVIAYLETEADEAVDRAIEIIRQRIDRFGVAEPSIQKQGTRRVVVELPGVTDAERVRDLLKNTARLEFRLMPNEPELNTAMQAVIQAYEPNAADLEADSLAADTLAADSTEALAEAIAPSDDTTATAADSVADLGEALAESDQTAATLDEGPQNALLQVFRPRFGGVELGVATAADTAEARRLLLAPEARDYWPNDFVMMWSSSPIGEDESGLEFYEAYAVRDNVELTGDAVVDATPAFDELNRPEVSMAMNSEGAQIWSRITGANIGKRVAIAMDNVVFSAPVVQSKISYGQSTISGLDSQLEQEDLVTLLKSGALPAPVDIVAEQTVGPSLGAESSRAGMLSLAVGLILVGVFMLFYYRTAGIVADLALLLNVIFIFGILAGFGATLTLPGMAGIVLTIGMAVDANVLIFERIREEQATGKTLKAAIAGGYNNALSAILDANITTFLVGAILFSFGKGPIQGFAVTLMAGIVSSLFTAIVFTRIIFDWLVIERRRKVSFG